MAKFENLFGRQVVTPPGRVQFPSLAEPDTGQQYSDDKYKMHLLFDPEEVDFKDMKEAIEELSQQAFGVAAKELDYLPFKDGNEKTWQGFPGMIYILVKSKYKPDVWSPKKDPKTGELFKIDPAKDIYPGVTVRAAIKPMAYKSRKNESGITFLLDFIQKLEDTPRFGGMGNNDARDVFEEYVPRSVRSQPPLNKPAEEAPESAEDDSQLDTAPVSEAKRRGRPPAAPKAETTESASEEESPSQKARRLAKEQRDADGPPVNGKAPADLPMATKKPAAKASGSLMDML